MTAKAISTRVQQMLNEYVAQDDNKNNKMYVVEGEEDTEFEGMMFAFCTTMEKAEKALGETYSEFEAVKYTTQIVNGTNYNIKVKVGGEKYIHIKVYVPLPATKKPNELLEQAKDKTLADPL